MHCVSTAAVASALTRFSRFMTVVAGVQCLGPQLAERAAPSLEVLWEAW